MIFSLSAGVQATASGPLILSLISGEQSMATFKIDLNINQAIKSDLIDRHLLCQQVQHCKRFYDEGKRHLFTTFEMIALEFWRDQNQKGYFVTDDTIMKRFRPGWVYDTTDQEPEKADTIYDLAIKLGVDPDALEKTINEYNAEYNDKPFDLMKLERKATKDLTPEKSN
jgi:hypothetical protein